MDTCIYCEEECVVPSEEHLIADALGGFLTLERTLVCKRCNSRLGTEVDSPVFEDLRPVLTGHGIKGKSRRPTTMVVTEDTPGGPRRFRVGKDDVSPNDHIKQIERGDNWQLFRADSIDELEEMRARIETKNPGMSVELELLGAHLPQLPEGRIDLTDFSKPHWCRWAAKTSISLAAYVLGAGVARHSLFTNVRHLALGLTTVVPPELTYGPCREGTIDEVEDLPPKHELRVTARDGLIEAYGSCFDYCWFKFEGEGPVAPAISRRIVLDAQQRVVLSDVCDLGA